MLKTRGEERPGPFFLKSDPLKLAEYCLCAVEAGIFRRLTANEHEAMYLEPEPCILGRGLATIKRIKGDEKMKAGHHTAGKAN